MNASQDNDNSASLRKVSLYGGLSYFFLLLLAIFWSVDASLNYIFFGIAFFFFFRCIQHLNVNRAEKPREDLKQDIDRPGEKDILHELKDVFKNKGITFEHEQKDPSVTQGKQRKVFFVLGTSFLFFVVMFFIIVFSSGDYDEEYFYQRGEMFYDQQAYDSAHYYFKKALTQNAESVQSIIGLGNTLTMKEQNDSAIIMYDKALSIEPENEKALYQKALVLYYQQQYDASVSQAKRLLDLNPSYFETMQLIGDDYYNREQYDNALTWYDDAYKNGVRNRYLCHLMGYIYQTKGNNEKAISLYKEALQYDSSVVDIYERLAPLVSDQERPWYQKKIAALQAGQ